MQAVVGDIFCCCLKIEEKRVLFFFIVVLHEDFGYLINRTPDD